MLYEDIILITSCQVAYNYTENGIIMLTNHTEIGMIAIEVKNMEFMTTKEAVQKWNIS